MAPTLDRALAGRPSIGLLGLLPLLAAGLGAQDAGAPAQAEDLDDPERVLKLSLEDALYLALEQNLDLELEELATEVADYTARGSWGAFDPFFSATGSYSEAELQGTSFISGGAVVEDTSLDLTTNLSVPFTTGTVLDFSYFRQNQDTTNSLSNFPVSTTDVVTVALTQPLLKGAGRRYATTLQREREIDFERQRARENEIRRLLVLDVYNAYWDLASAREEREVRILAVELGNQQLEQDRRRLDVGTGTEVDVLQSETNVAQQEEARINAEFLLRQAQDTLRRMLFQKPEEGDVEVFLEGWDWPIEPLTELPDVVDQRLDWRASLAHAIERRPELIQRRLEIDAAEVRLQGARSDRRPQLDLRLQSSGVGFDPKPEEAFQTAIGWDFPQSEAAIDFSVPILNRTARYAERAARAQVRAARLTYDRWELDLLAEVRAAVRDVAYRTESVAAATKSGDLARRQLEAEEARQRTGLSTTFQVLQFQQDLAEALSAEAAARAAYAKALAKLEHAEGRLDVEPRRTGGE